MGELAVQGPESERVMEEVLGLPCSELTFYTFKELDKDGSHLIVSRTGYTLGEDGFEIYADHGAICLGSGISLWIRRCAPCGLGCRDTLRFEVGLPLYGDELTDEITPLEAGLGIFVKLDKAGGFLGCEALKKQKAEGLRRKLVGLEIHDRAIARHGCEVVEPIRRTGDRPCHDQLPRHIGRQKCGYGHDRDPIRREGQ